MWKSRIKERDKGKEESLVSKEERQAQDKELIAFKF